MTTKRQQAFDKHTLKIQKENENLLAKEKDYKMSWKQTEYFNTYKELVEKNGCELISKVYIGCNVRMVIKCTENKEHREFNMIPSYIKIKTDNEQILCGLCQIADGYKNKKENKIKEVKEARQKEEAGLTPEQVRQKDIAFFASEKTVQEKKDRIKILNFEKDKSRKNIFGTCIQDGCHRTAYYGLEGIAIFCSYHIIPGCKTISRTPCCMCTMTGTIPDEDDNLYCLTHAIEAGIRKPKKRWFDSLEEGENVEDMWKMKYNNKRSKAMKTANETERFIFDLLKSRLAYAKIEHVGYKSNPMFDIEIMFDDSILRGIQVRTLHIKNIGVDNIWCFSTTRCNHKSLFPDNTLFLACNTERTLFIAIFSQDIDTIDFNYNSSNPENRFAKNVFTNKDEFITTAGIMAKSSIPVEGLKLRSSNSEKEYKMMKKLEETLPKEWGFQLNKQVFSAVDCAINNWNVQCKFTSSGKEKYTFYVHMANKVKTKSGKTRSIPYGVHDNIDAVIIQLKSRSNPEKYENDFLVIPRKELIALDVFQTTPKSGKTSISAPAPDYISGNFHVLFKYWNNWDCLKEKKETLDFKETKVRYTESELASIEVQEKIERQSYLTDSLTKARNDLLLAEAKMNGESDSKEEKLNEDELDELYEKKLEIYKTKLKDYLKFHGYNFRKQENRLGVYKLVQGKRSILGYRANHNTTIALAMLDLLENQISLCMTTTLAKTVISYFGEEIY